MTMKIKVPNKLKKVIITAFLTGNITLVGCNVNNYSAEQSTVKYDTMTQVTKNEDGTESIEYFGANGGEIVEEDGKAVEVVTVNSLKANAPAGKDFTEQDYITSIADKVNNYTVDSIVDNKVYKNFLYNPLDRSLFYDVRAQYGNRIGNFKDSKMAEELSVDAFSYLDKLLDKSIIEYNEACEYEKAHHDEIFNVYEQYQNFDFFLNIPHEESHELDKYAGLYHDDEGDFVKVSQFGVEVIDPDNGTIITIYPDKSKVGFGVKVNDRTIFNKYDQEYCKSIINPEMPEIKKDFLIEHGCDFNLNK